MKDFIKKILKEETNPMNMILRRVDQDRLEKEFEGSLSQAGDVYFKNYNKGISLFQFINTVLNMLIDSIHWELYSTTPDGSQWYDNVFYALKDYFFDRIEERYIELSGDDN